MLEAKQKKAVRVSCVRRQAMSNLAAIALFYRHFSVAVTVMARNQ